MAGLDLAGRLLVASPMLADPNFFRTVILLIEHNAGGALGVVLNRPSRTRLADPMPQWAPVAAEPGVIFLGGPVEHAAAIALGRLARASHMADPPPQIHPILGPVGVVDLRADATEMAELLDGVRMFAGYAGWGEGQLENEIAAGGWAVVDALPDEPLTRHPARLWSAALHRAWHGGNRLPGALRPECN